MIHKFQNDYNVSLRKILPSVSYYYYIEKQLKDFYKKGIISSSDLSQLHKDSLAYIQEIDQNTSHELAVQSIYTTKQAYESLICSDTLHFQKNLLQQCNLNNYLTPNLTYDAKRSEALRNDLLEDISWANGFVMNGQKIVDRGEIIDKRTFIILNSLQQEWDKRSETTTEKDWHWSDRYCSSPCSSPHSSSIWNCSAVITTRTAEAGTCCSASSSFQRDKLHYSGTSSDQCLCHSLCHGTYHHTYFSRFTNGLHGTHHPGSAMLHLPAHTA